MKILLFTQYYPPETGAAQNRLSHLAKELGRLGHYVEVLTSLPNYLEPQVYPEYVGRANSTETMEGIPVHRVGVYVPKTKTFWKRILHYLSFVWNAALFGPSLVKSDFDVVFTESPPLFICFTAVYFAQRFHAKLVMNISDLWPKSAVELDILKPGLYLWLAERLEAWTYRNAALITGQTDGIVENIRKRFPDKKTLLFANGVDLELFQGSRQDSVRERYGWKSGDFVVGYAGLLGHAPRLDQVLDAAKLLTDTPVKFVLFGNGPCREALAERIKNEKIGNVEIHPRVALKDMPALYAAWEAGCSTLGKGGFFKGTRPAKLFEMMAMGLPILLAAEGESERILLSPEGGAAGLVSAPENPELLAQNVRYLISHREEALQMGLRGKRYASQYFDRKKMVQELERHLCAINKKEIYNEAGENVR